MSATLPARSETTKAKTSVATCPPSEGRTTHDKPVGRSCLRDELEQSGVPKKVFAFAVLARDDEAQFSKMVAGTRPFDVDDLERLPREQLVGFLRRYCHALGLTTPRERDLAELSDDLLTQIDRVAQLVKLLRVRKPAAVKAELR